MTVVGEAIVLVRPLTAGFSEKVLADTDKAMVAAGRKAGSSFAQSLTSIIPGANGVQKSIVGIGAAAGAAVIASIHMANEFNQKLLLLHTQAGASTVEVDRMRGAILKLAPTVATGPAALAEALYHIESTGIRGAKALDTLTIAAQGAKIGQANLDDTTYALTSTLMTGIKGITGAKDAMSQLDAIVGTGDMHMQDLNGAISTGFLATAETFGVSLQSIGAALAYMTDRGSGAQESATRLRMSMALLAAPSNQAAKMLTAIGLGGADVTARTGAMTTALQAAHLTTTQLADDMRKPDGIQVALTDLTTHLKDSGLSADAAAALISRAFGGGRSGAAIMSLVQHLDVLKGKFDEQVSIAGTYDERWKATTESTSFRWAQFTTLVQTDAIKMGEALIPLANQLGSGLFNALSKAPQYLAPLGSGLEDVGRQLGFVLHQAEPLGRVFAAVFAGSLILTWQTLGFVLRDVVAPAIHLVGDVLGLLTQTGPGITILASVLTYKLLPVLINVIREMAAWALEKLVVGFYDVTVAAEGLGTALTTMNPIVLGVAIAIGASVGWYIKYTQAKKDATKATDDLVGALKAEATGHQDSIIVTLSKQLNDLHVGDDIARLGLNIRDVAAAANGSDSAWDKLNTQFRALTDSSRVSGAQLKKNRNDIGDVYAALDILTQRVQSADGAYAKQTINQQIANGAITAAKAPVDALASAQQGLAQSQKTLDSATGGLASSADTYATSLEKQFPIFDAYTAKLDLNGQTLLNNIEGMVKAIAGEQTNVNTLISRGLDPTVIKTLVGKGPEYVAAAAQLTTAQLARLQGDVSDYMTNIGTLSTSMAIHDGSQTGQAFTSALAAQQAATKRVAQITFFNSVQAALNNVTSIAGAQGGNAGGRFGDGLTRSKDQVLTAALNALPAPIRAATLQALGIATDAGGRLPHNLASAINENAPVATGAAEGMRRAVQARIDMLHGKTIEVKADNLASGALDEINGNIQTLEGLNNTLKAMRYADGGMVPGSGLPRGDNVLALVSSGEHITNTASAQINRPALSWMDSNPGQRLPRYADGGPVDAGSGMASWQVLMGRYAQSLATGTDPSKLTGQGITGSVMSWLPVVLMALALNGASASYAPRVLSQIEFESGGNPNAHQQVIDINTFNGSGGAQGIMQVLLDTFLANHVAGTSMNIFDPLANIAAGIHHAIHDDPGGLDYLGQGHGYDTGGPIPQGRTLVINNTGANEAWVLNEQGMAGQRGKGPVHLEQHNTFNGVDLDEAVSDVGWRMMHVVTSAMR